MSNRIILNETSYFGRGARNSLITELRKRKFDKALIITDEGIISSGVLDLITDILNKSNYPYEIYSDVKPNPTIDNVTKGLEVCKKSNPSVLIAVGGGSAIDTAKAISIIMRNQEFSDVASLDGVVETKRKGMPLIAIPTTAGTAAEVTINYVITDEYHGKKMVCVDPHDIPILSIIDQDLMDRMPRDIKAQTGMDALTHAMEGYITKNAWLISDMFTLNAMALIYKNLEKSVIDNDKEAMDNVGYGQYIAGMGFSNVGLGIVHSMAHSLGAMYDTPHGLANAILLPFVLKFNGEKCPQLFRNMGKAIGLDMRDTTDSEAVEKVVVAIYSLGRRLGIPATLKEVGVKEEDFDRLAEQALNDICTSGNPRNVTKNDIIRIYKAAYK